MVSSVVSQVRGRASHPAPTQLRELGRSARRWPVYGVDTRGVPRELGTLCALDANAWYVTSGPERIRGLYADVPYYLRDARCAGAAGRTPPIVSPAPPCRQAAEEHFQDHLMQRGADTTGNLLVGAEALAGFMSGIACPLIESGEREAAYPVFAAAALSCLTPESVARGRHPKFSACVSRDAARTHVIVKFSPPRATAAGQRWADLLTAEHLALRLLEEYGVAACRSSLIEVEDRLFLESERFDRVGPLGRRGAVSLYSVGAGCYGGLDSWTDCAARMAADALLSREDAECLQLLDSFGALIANTDRHLGNVSLFDDYEGRFVLAPVYDMLPMQYVPREAEAPDPRFEPPGPSGTEPLVWECAHRLAEVYWGRVSQDPRISAQFRQIGAENLAALRLQ